jgi:hypothetical protein
MSEETDEALTLEASLNFPAATLTIFFHTLVLFPTLIPNFLDGELERISQFSDSVLL